jgi:hypothetical protein
MAIKYTGLAIKYTGMAIEYVSNGPEIHHKFSSKGTPKYDKM